MSLLLQLPRNIILEILSRVPFEYAIQCKEVCKTWRNLLRDIKRDQKVNLLFAAKQESSCHYHGSMQLYQGEYDEKKNDLTLDEQLCHHALTLLGDPCIEDYNEEEEEYGSYRPMVGCHRGLVCFRATYDHLNDSIYICNPFTQETVLLPPSPCGFSGGSVVSGFGYLYSTNEYKVVRIHYGSRPYDGAQVHVYTLGDMRGWRIKDDIKYDCYPLSEGSNGVLSNGVLYDGALHWIDDYGYKIVAFDLADEKFRLPSIQLPPCFPIKYKFQDYCRYRLMMLGGYLSIVFMSYVGRYTDIYQLMETTNRRGCKLWNWSTEFTIFSTRDLQVSPWYPFFITGEDKVLMFKGNVKSWLPGRENILCCYDSKTNTVKEFVDDDEVEIFKDFQVVPYVKSDVSLTVLEPDLPVVRWD